MDTDPELEPPGKSDVPAPATTVLGRLSQMFLNPPKPKKDASDEDERPLTEAEVKAKVIQLDPLERKIGYLGAGMALVIALLSQLPGALDPLHHPVSQNVTPGKNHSCGPGFKYENVAHVGFRCTGDVYYPASHWIGALVLMLVFALALLVTTRIGRRAPLGFAAVMTGLAYETQVGLLGIPFLFAGGWLLIRAWRVQRHGSTKRPGIGSSNGARAANGSSRAPSARSSKKNEKAGPVKPAASKRYTPKAPTKKRPTPED
jgi:hypothetical protein